MIRWPWRRDELSKSDLRIAINECGLRIAALMQANDRLQDENERLQAQLDLSAQAWKTWEATLRGRDMEIAELHAELRRIKLGGS